jgi:hypothetical protein
VFILIISVYINYAPLNNRLAKQLPLVADERILIARVAPAGTEILVAIGVGFVATPTANKVITTAVPLFILYAKEHVPVVNVLTILTQVITDAIGDID